MAGPFDMISAIHPGKDSWRLRVRVARLWEMCSIVDPSRPFAIDMVLIDVEGGNIQATIRKPMMKKFKDVIVEGEVYTMLNFAVIKNVGSYRASRHEYKLLFSAKTKVFPAKSCAIPSVGLSLMSTEQITKTNGESNYLFDFMGVLTAISAEKVVETEGRKTRMMEMELADDKGRLRCTVFGDYVETLNSYVALGVTPLPVVVVQLFKVRLYKGNVVLQNVNNTSRILWNPDFTEANNFRNSLACHGIDSDVEIGVIEPGNRVVPLADDFLRLHPRKTLNELQITEEDGIFIVHGTIVSVLKEEQWWYGACKCYKAVTPDGGLYYCSNCCTHVVEVTPRYKVKVEVFHWDDSACLILFDSDCVSLLAKPCKELLAESKGSKAGELPSDIMGLIGKELLFKVEKTAEVVEICLVFTCLLSCGSLLLVELQTTFHRKLKTYCCVHWLAQTQKTFLVAFGLMRCLNRRRVRMPGRNFFVVFREYEGHIPIPRWFFQRWGDLLDDIVLLKDPVGNLFPVYICIRNERGYFFLGVEKLRTAYALHTTFTVAFLL
ncbi:hypothetical protein SESBI_43577 [Sesbania bispinosa]|nr:hypothetical protein SESBI_43577 [Sesbania bispinosa]